MQTHNFRQMLVAHSKSNVGSRNVSQSRVLEPTPKSASRSYQEAKKKSKALFEEHAGSKKARVRANSHLRIQKNRNQIPERRNRSGEKRSGGHSKKLKKRQQQEEIPRQPRISKRNKNVTPTPKTQVAIAIHPQDREKQRANRYPTQKQLGGIDWILRGKRFPPRGTKQKQIALIIFRRPSIRC